MDLNTEYNIISPHLSALINQYDLSSKYIICRIRNDYHIFPKTWSIADIVKFANTDIKVCEICNKVDINLDHYIEHF